MEPERRNHEEHQHRDELRAISQEHREIGHGAKDQQHDGRQRMEGVDVSPPDRAERPLLSEQDDVERHVRIAEKPGQT